MIVHHDINQLPSFDRAVVTVGSFDGVHVGHRKILEQLVTTAQRIGGQSIVVSFDPHPRLVLYPEKTNVSLLHTIEEKTRILRELGIDHFVIVPFTKEFSMQSPEYYIEDFLVKNFKPHTIFIGHDHRFGYRRSGDIETLKAHSDRMGYRVIEIPVQLLDQIKVSSSKIRKAIADKNIELANKLLQHPYSITGTVTHGDKIGRTMGYPTANISVDYPYKLIPPDGIYAVYCYLNNQRHQGMLYIGTRPSLGEQMDRVIEVHILDFSQNIYRQKIRVELLKFLREDKSFKSKKELAIQIKKDQKDTLKYFEKNKINKYAQTAVVVLNYNGEKLLPKYIPDLIRYTQADIIIADNHSDDGSIQYLKSLGNKIRILSLDQNYGFAEGYNKAIDALSAYEYILLLNSDVRVTPEWLDPLLKQMQAEPKLAAVQPKIKSDTQTEFFEYAGAAGGYIDVLGYPFCRGRVFDTLEKDQGQYDQIKGIHWASGAAMLIRTTVFVSAGGFDKDYFAHQEEIDLCWRVRNMGYSIQVIPQGTVYHLGGGTLSYQSTHKLYLNFRNNIITIIKNEYNSNLMCILIKRLFLDTMAGTRFLLQGKFSSFWAIKKAWLWIIFHFIKLLKKRSQTKNTVRLHSISSPNIQKKFKSILIPYFFQNKKTFDQIYPDA